MVRESDRAWHAGKSFWRGITDVNSASVGIEIVNPGHEYGYVDFPRAQMRSVIALCSDIRDRHGIRPAMVLAHSDVAPGRKVDPGERFNWRLLASHGLGHFVAAARIRRDKPLETGAAGDAVQQWQSMLSLYGYGIDITATFDDRTNAVTAAFQRHFRPRRVDGRADWSSQETLRQLLQSMPEAFA
jgi:N-acetylmuramoyl-L-alanine amidase